MNTNHPVPLVRRFSPVRRSPSDSDEHEIQAIFGYGNVATWEEIDKRYRSVVLAEAGAGKTFEMQARARYVESQAHLAFFIRIEDIVDNFEQAFEVGSVESFEQWLVSQRDAWFYLDSVDEARLDNPTTFEKAIRRFSKAIKNAQQRAHVCVSSRPYAWRPKSDRELIQRHLPLPKPRTESTGEDLQTTDASEPQDALEIFKLLPLDENDIRLFAQHRSIKGVDRLIHDLGRLDLLPLAGRPFDLEGILHKWASDLALGGRSELLRHNVEMRLNESHNLDRVRRQPLNLGKAIAGARRIAAAVVLTGKAGIQVPDSVHTRIGIDAQAVLSDWDPNDVQTLLERAIFDEVICGAVRFRHRDVRELLAAEWFSELLQQGHSRHGIESLFFREQYGQEIISPRLRVILPWLILNDNEIRRRTLAIHPEITMEGGDPARLPLPVRENILSDVVGRVVRGEDYGAAGDNSALARIARTDLTKQTLVLIDRHPDNDEALFFLGRLVWQGAMSGCVPRLVCVAADPARGIYARIAATRAVATCGSQEQRGALWDFLLAADEEIPRELLAELIRGAADTTPIPKLLQSINKLPSPAPFKITGLTSALHGFVDRVPLPANAGVHEPFGVLVRGLDGFLHRPPSIEPGSCDVSEKFIWLLDPATHAVERLVLARIELAFDKHVLAILQSAPTARHWRDRSFDDRKDKLWELVPAWPELNDALFWYNAKVTRIRLEAEGKELNDDWPLQWPDHYWTFGPASFLRILDWVRARELKDDKLLALSLAFRIYVQAERPASSLDQLRESVRGDIGLRTKLDELLNPTVQGCPQVAAATGRAPTRARPKPPRGREKRSDWVARLKADIVRRPPGLPPGEISEDQYRLLREVEGDKRTSRSQGAAWRTLIDEFGEDVAIAYRDAAKAHWRHCKPGLRSEGSDTSFPYSFVFAMAGLAIEADEVDQFPRHLSASEVCLALRYIVLELNGFPSWLEGMYRVWPEAVLEAILTELFWELDNTQPNQPMHYILHDLAVYASWLHRALLEPILDWVRTHELPSDDALRHSLRILKGGGLGSAELVTVAKTKATDHLSARCAYWYAIWVDAEPDTGVNAVTDWLDGLGSDEGSHAAQLFITALMGNRHGADSRVNFEGFQTPRHLKSLYVLMHRHIRATEDIDRSGGGGYTPGLRDDAQEARARLFVLLSEFPGKETYVALTELIEEHPYPSSRPWMAKRARQRAEVDGDLEPWTAEQVAEFGAKLTRTPASHRQLFDLTVARVTDLKNWVERGNDSPYHTWQKADSEHEIRNLVAGWLNQNWTNPATIAQEPELANGQRMDIWLQNQNVPSPVPVELKLLDKRWTGPKLCERLRNQLAGDYLREATGGCGLMLLIWQGSKPLRRWMIDGRRVGIAGLRDALKGHWATFSNSFPNVATVEVVVIDLTLRAGQASEVREG